MDFDLPITTEKMAKSYFTSMGCSHFHMAREYPARYDEYKKFGITQETERLWKFDSFEMMYKAIWLNGNEETTHILHSSMADLACSLDTEYVYEKMLAATHRVLKTTPDGFRFIVAETVVGRNDYIARSGFIYHTYDLGRPDLAKEFALLSLKLAAADDVPHARDINNNQSERIRQVVLKCKSIREELNI